MNLRLFARAVHATIRLAVFILVILGLTTVTGSLWWALGALLALVAGEWWALLSLDRGVAYYHVAWPTPDTAPKINWSKYDRNPVLTRRLQAELNPDSMMSD